jgi:tetratricopeptide (TPR) repeat protein
LVLLYMRFIFVCLVFCCAACMRAGASGYIYDYDDNCSQAYQCFMAMQFQEGKTHLFREFRKNPYNLMATYIADYEDCLVLLLTADRQEYEQRRDHYDERLDLLSKGDEKSPWYRLCKAGVYLHWAMIHMRLGDQFKAATIFRKSYIAIKENERLFPGFEYNQLFDGIKESVAGTIPDNYKWLASIFGIRGEVMKGAKALTTFVNGHTAEQPLQIEGALFSVYIRFYLLNEQKQVWEYLCSDRLAGGNNLLNIFIKSNIGVNYRQAETVIMLLGSELARRAAVKYPILDYQMGTALLFKQDTGCLYYFSRFLQNNKGNPYIKDTWYRMAIAYYLQHDLKQAQHCREQIVKYGGTMADADAQAQRFAKEESWPYLPLLRARLYIDGGYYAEAAKIMAGILPAELTTETDRLEYYFRFGRLYEETGNLPKAKEFYEYTIRIGQNRQEHFAARSALQLGMIYERADDKPAAIAKYKQCLAMRHHDFQNSIEQQAKAGISRVSR